MDFLNNVKDTFTGTKHGSSAVNTLLSPVTSSIGTVYKDSRSVVHSVSKGASTVYKDARSATAYTGKHLINDVDNLSSSLSNPILILGVVVVGAVLISKM